MQQNLQRHTREDYMCMYQLACLHNNRQGTDEGVTQMSELQAGARPKQDGHKGHSSVCGLCCNLL